MTALIPSKNSLSVDCCIVGGGPAGVVLALLLARQGVEVCLLEAHRNFDREFRGDMIHSSTLEMLDQIGLVDKVLALAPDRVTDFPTHFPDGSVSEPAPWRLNSKYPFTLFFPQALLLEVLVSEAQKFSNFHLLRGARAEQLLEHDDLVYGVRYRDERGSGDVIAELVVGADGRFSRIRQLARIPIDTNAQPMDVLWLRLPRRASDPPRARGIYPAARRMLVLMDRPDEWQVGYVFPKGSYQQLRAEGIAALRQSIVEIAPWLGDRLELLVDWTQTSLLNVEAGRVRRWFRPGLLLIGDAAHVMSPVAGVGINYAIQDAIVASNRLGPRLLGKQVQLADLAAVQRRREWPTRLMQSIQSAMQRELPSSDGPPAAPPLALRMLERVPLYNELRTRLIAYGGLRPERVAPLQPKLRGASRELTPRADAELVEHALQMVGSGLLSDHQRFGNLPVGHSASHQAGDV